MTDAAKIAATEWDWIGAPKRRFNWRTFRFEWGRWGFKTNACGDTLASGWIPDDITKRAEGR